MEGVLTCCSNASCSFELHDLLTGFSVDWRYGPLIGWRCGLLIGWKCGPLIGWRHGSLAASTCSGASDASAVQFPLALYVAC